ncbi:MAG: hypothetical protein A2189_01070 [Paenibacillus sp. RIFOXYA1_FULL_44_5]|nr:MAG: hypothetical protein A2189_01070 [Paenibacillus sp. RIFOXYA1_FULL_44_5]
MWAFNSGLLVLLIMLAFYTDVKAMRIPNKLTAAGAVGGMLVNFLRDGWQGLFLSMTGLTVGFILVFILYVVRAVGAGDVKLFAAIGAISGFQLVLSSLMYSILYAGMIGLWVVVFRRGWLNRLKRVVYYIAGMLIQRDFQSMKEQAASAQLHKFPFMYAVLPGVVTAIAYSMN